MNKKPTPVNKKVVEVIKEVDDKRGYPFRQYVLENNMYFLAEKNAYSVGDKVEAYPFLGAIKVTKVEK